MSTFGNDAEDSQTTATDATGAIEVATDSGFYVRRLRAWAAAVLGEI